MKQIHTYIINAIINKEYTNIFEYSCSKYSAIQILNANIYVNISSYLLLLHIYIFIIIVFDYMIRMGQLIEYYIKSILI